MENVLSAAHLGDLESIVKASCLDETVQVRKGVSKRRLFCTIEMAVMLACMWEVGHLRATVQKSGICLLDCARSVIILFAHETLFGQ